MAKRVVGDKVLHEPTGNMTTEVKLDAFNKAAAYFKEFPDNEWLDLAKELCLDRHLLYSRVRSCMFDLYGTTDLSAIKRPRRCNGKAMRVIIDKQFSKKKLRPRDLPRSSTRPTKSRKEIYGDTPW